jgi:AcrR family transcriptional regulator
MSPGRRDSARTGRADEAEQAEQAEGSTSALPQGGPATGTSEDEPAKEGRPDGRQARWARHNEERREQIIAAAVEVIAAGQPGAEVHVQQIAERAGVNRTVVYRYFNDRADLDLAIQRAIVAQLWERLLPAVTLEGTVPEIIDRIVGTYVDWAVSHPALHHVVDHDYGSGALEQALDEIASAIGQVVTFAIAAFGGVLEFDEDELDPLMHGLVGAVFGSVRRWLNRPEPVLSAERLRSTVSRSVWFVLDGHARQAGVTLDPERTVAEMLEAATLLSGQADTVAP